MSYELITSKLNELDSLTEMEIMKPTIPVQAALQESEELLKWCLPDKEILVRSGLDWKLVDDLPVRTSALRVIQSKWTAAYKNYQDCQEVWRIAAPAASNLRDELVHHFLHAFTNNKSLTEIVRRIADGKSNSEMIQNLLNLYELGTQNPKELEAIGFDFKTLEDAREKSFVLGGILADVKKALHDTNPVLELRNKAYSHLKEAVDEIRRKGQYAFWRDDDKLLGYGSPYLRKMNSRKKDKEDAKATS
jgi:hypothetical protein